LLRKLAPIFTVLLSVLLDSSVIHVLYHGVYLIPVSLIVVIMISMLLGRAWGVLYGLIAGLILDVSTGSLGIKLFGYIAIGFMIGLMLDQQNHRGAIERDARVKNIVSRAIWVAVFVGLYEIILIIYQYFSTAVMEWGFVRNMLIRIGMMTALSSLLYPLFRRLYLGKRSRFAGHQNTREVKSF